MRLVHVTSEKGESFAAVIDGLKDSEGLHYLLTEVDPGELYTAMFYNTDTYPILPKHCQQFDFSK